MIDTNFLGKSDHRQRCTDSSFQVRMEFYSLTREIDFKSIDYLKDICKIYDGISQHCNYIEELGYENTPYHEELTLMKDYINYLHETYHPELSLSEVLNSNQLQVEGFEYPEDFDPPQKVIHFIDDLDEVSL